MKLRRKRRVKILATLGPSSNTQKTIEKLHEVGADVFRINMSHTSHENAKKLHDVIRAVEKKFGRPIGILCDLQGPKLRIGAFEGKNAPKKKIELEIGKTFTLDQSTEFGDAKRVELPHPEIFAAVEPGHKLLLDDGKLKLEVISNDGKHIRTQVLVGGTLSSRKGISLPDTILPVGALTKKDREDLEYVVKNLDIDWIALSFVQRVDDVLEVKKLSKNRVSIMAKIEKPSAVEDLDKILKVSDGLMIARGDLGVELPLEKVPALQKEMLRKGRRAGKPVVVATQMLESMINAPVPTRAEVSDVATAVYEGADAIMLSAESAAGKFPVEAVEMMNRIAEQVETGPIYEQIIHSQIIPPEETAADAISAAASSTAETLHLTAIICYTASGSTGLRAARMRPMQPILGLTPIMPTARRLTLVWGLYCVITDDPEDMDNMVDKACTMALEHGFADPGDRVIITAGVPLGTSGATNMLRIAFVGENGSLPG